jgi:GMP synthase (glutamine-hydrolysing)
VTTPVKPFLLLATRAEDVAADDEYESIMTLTGLDEGRLTRIRLEQRPLGPVDLSAVSGIFLGGGPFNSSDPESTKSPVQRRVEADLHGLLDQVVGADFPFLGACYGIGTLGTHQGAEVGRRYAEPVGAITISLTAAGRQDPLMAAMPSSFGAFVAHKEAISRLPTHAVLLASGVACPVQAFRVGRNVYATQFHPELDAAGLITRIEVYKDAGYFAPGEAGQLKAMAHTADVAHAPDLLRGFVRRYSTAN